MKIQDKELQYRSFHEARVQSIGPIGPDGLKRYTVGVCLPGKFEFVADIGSERIRIVAGSCSINGTALKAGEEIFVLKDHEVVMESAETFAYYCQFER